MRGFLGLALVLFLSVQAAAMPACFDFYQPPVSRLKTKLNAIKNNRAFHLVSNGLNLYHEELLRNYLHAGNKNWSIINDAFKVVSLVTALTLVPQSIHSTYYQTRNEISASQVQQLEKSLDTALQGLDALDADLEKRGFYKK